MSATQPTDRELVLAAQAGDVATLGLLLERHRASVYGACVRILGRGPAAQDAVQDACVVALRRLHELRDADAFAGWLHAIARNACLMELRRAARVRNVDEVDDGAVPSLEEELERTASGRGCGRRSTSSPSRSASRSCSGTSAAGARTRRSRSSAACRSVRCAAG
jgi:RNA polymerase sigma factor (sigma-70 family)